jgi:hypothetical protein
MQSVWMSGADSRVSGRSSVQALPGMVPSLAVSQDEASNVCCRAGEYVAHSEKLRTLRPSTTPLAITHDTGAICVYHEVGHTVSFE